MQYVFLLSNHALYTGVVQHACLFCKKCDLHNVSKMPSVITIYGADIELKYSQVIQSSLTQCYSRFARRSGSE